MKENSDILRLRVLLAFLNDDEPCTVMSIARTLKEEHYTCLLYTSIFCSDRRDSHRGAGKGDA